jgi:hypothetical protein
LVVTILVPVGQARNSSTAVPNPLYIECKQ